MLLSLKSLFCHRCKSPIKPIITFFKPTPWQILRYCFGGDGSRKTVPTAESQSVTAMTSEDNHIVPLSSQKFSYLWDKKTSLISEIISEVALPHKHANMVVRCFIHLGRCPCFLKFASKFQIFVLSDLVSFKVSVIIWYHSEISDISRTSISVTILMKFSDIISHVSNCFDLWYHLWNNPLILIFIIINSSQ